MNLIPPNNLAINNDVWLTRGLIIILEDNSQVSFEKDIWFSEIINIEQGDNLADKFVPTEEVIDDCVEPYRMICEREIIHL